MSKREMVYRCEAEGDTIYVHAVTMMVARAILRKHMGDIPDSLLKWSGPVPLPKGEEALR